MVQALEGIKVLHLYRTQPSSFAATFLSDFGADVTIIVEPGWGARLGEDVASMLETTVGLDRNKRNMTLNLKSQEGKQIFLDLAREADVVIDGMRPGVTARLGLDYADLEANNPRLIYVSVSGYGRDNALSRMAGHDINYLGMAGLLAYFAQLDGPGRFLPLVPVADSAAGVYGAIGALLALQARERTGVGQLVDVSYVDAMLSFATSWVLVERATNERTPLPASMMSGFFPFYGVYETRDDRLVSVAAIEPWFWENLCRAMGLDELIPLAFDGPHREYVRGELTRVFRERSRDEWDALLLRPEANTCYAPVRSLEEALASDLVRERDMVVRVERDGRSVDEIGVPITLSKTPGSVRRADPSIGQDTDAVLRGMGLADGQIAELRARGIVD